MSKKQKLEHRVFGLGTVKYKTVTDYGHALVVKFPDKTRTILLNADGADTWVNPEHAIAAWEHAKEKPQEKGPPKKAKRVRRADDFQPEPEFSSVDVKEV